MKMTKSLIATGLLSVTVSALAQSDGRSFDAATVLIPGLSLERDGVIRYGDYTSTRLQDGDILRTANDAWDVFMLITSDGSVIGLEGATTVTIDGSQRGFSVFQVNYGKARILGNVNRGFIVPPYLNEWVPGRVPVDPVPMYYNTGARCHVVGWVQPIPNCCSDLELV